MPGSHIARRFGIALGVLVGAVGLAALVGWMLPVDHTATRRARFAHSPAEVWDVVVDFERASTWRTNVERIEVVDDDTFVEHTDEGPVRMRVVVREPPSRLVVAIDDPELPFSGTWTYELAPRDGGTELVITERGSVPNPIIRLMAAMFFDPAETARRYLVDLGARFDESVAPTP
jgi:uncharacterized protein YndB with AHSA1/START domain